jgi:hypothetical protein
MQKTKTILTNINSSSQIHVLFLLQAPLSIGLKCIKFFAQSQDLMERVQPRTKGLLGQTNFLWAYTHILADAGIFLGKKLKKLNLSLSK